ncbi:MAG: helix-turn-helix domain-containing protein [Bdellovibrionales bacterium]|nr:helix-turn-helix domain-containing protein [Bdellovibrionales bacterium]
MATRNFFDLKLPKATPGKVIKAFRKNFNITQQELAAVTGIAEANLSAIENDKVEIGVKRAVLIAAALGINPSGLLFPNGYETSYEKDVKAVQVASAKMMSKKKVG